MDGVKTKPIPIEVIDRLSYDKDTGVFIWNYKNKHHPRLFGTKAGTINQGYLKIRINGDVFLASRIAWFMVTGDQPKIMDHINGDTLDNRFNNLRNVSYFENNKNHCKKINNSNLPCGVRITKNSKYQARITCNKIAYNLGVFSSINDAENAYLTKRKELFAEYERKNC